MKSWDGKTKQEGSGSVWWMQAVREQRTEYLRGHKAQTWPPWTYGHKGGQSVKLKVQVWDRQEETTGKKDKIALKDPKS